MLVFIYKNKVKLILIKKKYIIFQFSDFYQKNINYLVSSYLRIKRNQTNKMKENKKKVQTQGGVWASFVDVFGNPWPINHSSLV